MPSGDWRRISLLFPEHFADIISPNIPQFLLCLFFSFLSGLCLPRCLEGEASFLTRLQRSRAAAARCLRLRAPFKEISFELFQTVLFCAEGFAWPCAAVAINHGPGAVAIDVCRPAKAIFGVCFAVILYS